MAKYDAAIVGAGLGGLAAAALLSQERKKVLLTDPSGSVGGVLALREKNGYRFSAGLPLSYGFEQGGALQTLCSRLGITQQVSPVSPCYQIALPDRRITVYPQQSETIEELRREFPREIDVLAKCYRDIRKIAEQNAKSRFNRYLAVRRSAESFISRYRFSRDLTAFFDVQARVFFRNPLASMPLASLVLMADTPPSAIQGGFFHLAEQLLEVHLKHNGELSNCEPWPEVIVAKNRVSGLRTSRETIDASAVLLNVRGEDGEAALFLGIQDAVVPLGMTQQVICLPDYADPAGLFTLSLSAKDDESAAPRGMRSLTASFRLAGRTLPSKERLSERIGELIPFLKDFLKFDDVYEPSDREYHVPGRITLRSSRGNNGQAALIRSSSRSLYVIHDNFGAPLRAVQAARQFVERLA